MKKRYLLQDNNEMGVLVDIMKKQKILIIGGAGFIGAALAEHYCDQNEITIVDNCEWNKSSLRSRGLLEHHNIKKISLDATSEVIMNLEKDYDYIIHAAAILGISKVAEESILTITTNINSCEVALRLAKEQIGLKKFLTFSTSEVYGKKVEEAKETDDLVVGMPNEARWCYAASKILCEHYVSAYSREQGLPTIIIRPFNVFGEHRKGSNAMTKFIKAAINNENIYIDGTGNQIRSWCHINDFIQGVTKALENGTSGEIFNIGNPNNVITIKELVKYIVKLTDSKSKIYFSKNFAPDVNKRTLSIEKAQTELGYVPKISLEEGISSTINWMKRCYKIA